MMALLLVIGGVLLLFVFMVIATYNSLVKLRNLVDSAWSGITIQLKLRADLIPNLVATVKGYAAHEESVFSEIADARARMAGTTSPKELANANEELTGALGRLFAVAENYPDLKASTNFSDLQTELSDIENKIQAARRGYNNGVTEYNTKLQIFPNNIIASMFNFKEREFFGVSEEESKKIADVPTVDFSNNREESKAEETKEVSEESKENKE